MQKFVWTLEELMRKCEALKINSDGNEYDKLWIKE